MEYMPQVKVSKEDFLALSDLAGEMSIMDYMSKVIHEHVAAQQSVYSDAATVSNCKHNFGDGLYCIHCGEVLF
jgi:hypothetical protein